MHPRSAGLSIIELLVVISIIGILASVILFSVGESTAQSRDAERKADLRAVQNALELYKNKYGRYPEQCSTVEPNSVTDGWSGQIDTDFRCDNGTNEYIVGLAPEFLPTIPTDPRLQAADDPDEAGYVYRVGNNGNVYKFKVLNTVESETVTLDHPFKPCDTTNDGAADSCSDTELPEEADGNCYFATCDFVDGVGLPSACNESDAEFQNSYAVWGGFGDTSGYFGNSDAQNVEENTEEVICK